MNTKKLIVIVDDEKDILELVKFNVEKHGFNSICIENGELAIRKIKEVSPDLVILDLMLPGIDGLDVCRVLKNNEKTQNIPILMLSARGEDADVVRGLEIGADDYVVKPFSLRILMARIDALIRRQPDSLKSEILLINGMHIHPGTRDVKIDNKLTELTFTEFEILYLLASHPNWVYTRNQIIDEIRGDDYPVTDRSIDFQIVGLRKKLGSYSSYIKTVRGVGYRFIPEE